MKQIKQSSYFRKEVTRTIRILRDILRKNKFKACKGDLRQTCKIINQPMIRNRIIKLPTHHDNTKFANQFEQYCMEK